MRTRNGAACDLVEAASALSVDQSRGAADPPDFQEPQPARNQIHRQRKQSGCSAKQCRNRNSLDEVALTALTGSFQQQAPAATQGTHYRVASPPQHRTWHPNSLVLRQEPQT
jgi:hypothetical protein